MNNGSHAILITGIKEGKIVAFKNSWGPHTMKKRNYKVGKYAKDYDGSQRAKDIFLAELEKVEKEKEDKNASEKEVKEM